MVHPIPPSPRELLPTGAAATSGLLLGHQQEAQAPTDEADGCTLGGLPTGFQQLDVLTGGLHRREFVLLASRPGVGKTSLALHIADYVAVEARTLTLYVSLGTSRLQITRRLMCARGEVPHTAMQQNTLPPDVRLRLTQAGSELRTAPLYLDDRPLHTTAEIAATTRRLNDRLAPEAPLGLLVVDHLQRVEAEYTGQTESEHLTAVAYELREMAIDMNVVVLGLMQLNCHPPAGQQARPALAELRGTQHAADLVMLLHRPETTPAPSEPQTAALESKAELSVIGRSDCLAETLELAWTSQYTRFSDHAARL